MIRNLLALCLALFVAGCTQLNRTTSSDRETTLRASDLALKSSGQANNDGSWTMSSNGYVGTFIKLETPREVEVAFTADGIGATRPRANLVIGDAKIPFEIASSTNHYSHRFSLPAGTHFIRLEFTSRRENPDQSLTIRSFTVDGAPVSNELTDANALDTADTYIRNSRCGPVTIQLPQGVATGTTVDVTLVRKAFNFGTNAPGTENKYLIDNPRADSDSAKFQKFIVEHFNMLVPSNSGKWVYHEPTPGQVNMSYADDIMRFAREHQLRGRMHTMIWETEQQPQWALDLLAAADKGDAQARAKLRQAISNRIKYYVADRAKNYVELDVHNESVHRYGYWKVFGADGIADIFKEVQSAAKSGGADPMPRLMLNEYNVLQWSRRPPFKEDNAQDPFANWYREHVEDLVAAGGPISGIGVQYNADFRPEALEKCPHSAARIFCVLQNLCVTGLPITLTEYSVTIDATPEQAANVYYQTMRLVYGTPNATSFLLWGFWQGANPDRTYLANKDWTLSPSGRLYERLMKDWSTNETLTVGEDRTISFNGFFGDYDVKVGEKAYRISTSKGTSRYVVESR